MMQVIEGSFTPIPDAVGEIVAFDMVHGWHFQPYVDWEEIGAGAKLYTAAQLTAFAKEVARKSQVAPTRGADDTQVVIAGLNALLHDAQDEIARLTSTQGADARPVAIYQLKLASGDWRDQDESAYRNNLKHYPDDVRIVYATRATAPSDGIVPREVKRDSDFSVTVVFASCRLASEFERQMIAAIAPRDKT